MPPTASTNVSLHFGSTNFVIEGDKRESSTGLHNHSLLRLFSLLLLAMSAGSPPLVFKDGDVRVPTCYPQGSSAGVTLSTTWPSAWICTLEPEPRSARARGTACNSSPSSGYHVFAMSRRSSLRADGEWVLVRLTQGDTEPHVRCRSRLLALHAYSRMLRAQA